MRASKIVRGWADILQKTARMDNAEDSELQRKIKKIGLIPISLKFNFTENQFCFQQMQR